MSVKLRMKRMGKKGHPYYRIVAADSRMPRDGRIIEEVGLYDPNENPAMVKLDVEKIDKWLNDGAQPSDTVRSLLSNEGILKKFHDAKFSKKK